MLVERDVPWSGSEVILQFGNDNDVQVDTWCLPIGVLSVPTFKKQAMPFMFASFLISKVCVYF